MHKVVLCQWWGRLGSHPNVYLFLSPSILLEGLQGCYTVGARGRRAKARAVPVEWGASEGLAAQEAGLVLEAPGLDLGSHSWDWVDVSDSVAALHRVQPWEESLETQVPPAQGCSPSLTRGNPGGGEKVAWRGQPGVQPHGMNCC